MKIYTFTGKERSAACGKMIVPGCKYELDEKDSRVQSLCAKGLLEEVPDSKSNKKTKKQ